MNLPRRVGDVEVPGDAVSEAAWREAVRSLPVYLLDHSVRSFCWGVAIAGAERWSFDRRILWTAALLHDRGLTRIGRNGECFEVAGGSFARRFLERAGMPAADAAQVDRAIVLHMQPGVTLADGVEALLLDRATAVDVRGVDFEVIAAVRAGVLHEHPRGAFDRHFLAAIRRESLLRPGCQSARLLRETGLAEWMARSPWSHGQRAEEALTRRPRP
jgi:HD superfamily phosphodiesterase